MTTFFFMLIAEFATLLSLSKDRISNMKSTFALQLCLHVTAGSILSQ